MHGRPKSIGKHCPVACTLTLNTLRAIIERSISPTIFCGPGPPVLRAPHSFVFQTDKQAERPSPYSHIYPLVHRIWFGTQLNKCVSVAPGLRQHTSTHFVAITMWRPPSCFHNIDHIVEFSILNHKSYVSQQHRTIHNTTSFRYQNVEIHVRQMCITNTGLVPFVRHLAQGGVKSPLNS